MRDEPPLFKFTRDTPSNHTRLAVDMEKLAAVTSALAAGLATALGGVTAFTWDGPSTQGSQFPSWFWPSAGVVALLILLALGTTLVVRERRKAALKREEQKLLENAADRLKEHMELASLVNFNRILLERYHGIATKQANKSFVSSIAAMAVGLAVLIGAFVASMHYNSQGERVFIGSLAALATVFVGYLSKTFLAVYDRSLQQLNQYFNQPVLNQYFLTAERVVERLDGPRREELLTQIVLDVLDTGKHMHQTAAAKSTSRPKARAKVTRQRVGQEVQQQPPQ
ncbi:hypothetical protein ACIQ7Q_03975 [Streptomyces sp. NPDC096176]|uniref:TRADD-N-associated membrane domain-containing protein n=1 Tax=Streptomyces sp. NPDC096176 TaxID=3366079 RepID=UPI00380C8CA8